MELQQKQTFIHIGYHKCGSTYLQHNIFPNLNANYIHVDDQMVEFCGQKNDFEPSVLKTWVNQHKKNLFNTTILSKESLSGHPNGYKNPDPFIIANNLKSTYPNAKILIMIRNQFDYLASIYAFRVVLKGVETRSFKKFLMQQGKLGLFDKLEYHNLVSHYIDLFGHKNILVLPLEFLAKDNYEFLEKISIFLDFNSNLTSKEVVSSPKNVSTRNKKIVDFMRIMNIPFKLIFRYQKYIVNAENAKRNRLLHFKIKEKIVTLMNYFFGYYNHNQSIIIPQEIEKQLIDKYQISNLNLQSMIDVNLNKYGYFID